MKKYILLLTLFMIVGYAGAQTRITAWEYWFDNNYSQVVNQNSGASDVLAIDQTIDVSSLNFGLHTVHLRFKDERGIWSPIVSRFFTWYPGSGTPDLKEITAVEYWFDNDYSAVVSESITASTAFDFEKSLDVSALKFGLHNVHFRFKDERGIWSPIVSRFFTWYPGSGAPELKEITAVEYWYDNDYSAVFSETVTPSTGFNLEKSLDVSALNFGLHTVHFRFKDERGIWSPIISRFFTWYPGSGAPELKEITAYEFWLDNDYSSATVKDVAATGKFNIDDILDVSALKNGLHTIHFRFKDERGVWNASQSKYFVKYEQATTYPDNEIVAYRYWVGDRLETMREVKLDVPVKSLVLDEKIDVTGYPSGEQHLNIQFKDKHSGWSVAVADTVILEGNPWADLSASVNQSCFGESIAFTADTVDVTDILWNFGDGFTSTELNPIHQYDTVGKFEVSALVTHMPSGKSGSVKLADSIEVYPTYSGLKDVEICASETPYTFGTRQLTASGTYTETFQTVHGCDSVVTLNLTVYPDYSAELGCNGLTSTVATHSETENLNQIVKDEFGNSASVADWNDLKAVADIDAWISCMKLNNDDLIWLTRNGAFNSGSRYYFVAYYPGGAPSYFAVHDQIGNKLFLGSWYGLNMPVLVKGMISNAPADMEICSSETPFLFGTQQLNNSGTYTETFQTVYGCDSIVTLKLVVNTDYAENQSETICESELPYLFGSQSLNSSGDFTETFQSVSGCDSVVTLTLTVNPNYNETVSETICENELPFVFGSQSLTSAGDYTGTFQSVNGCDSVITLTLMVNPTYNETVSETICENQLPFIFGTQSINSSGDYTETFQSVNGCDSVVTLTLTVNPNYNKTVSETICESELPFIFGTRSLNSSGDYTETFQSVNGCDSVVNLTLKVNPTLSETKTETICENELPFVFGSQSLTSAGDYTGTFQSVNGCDSIVFLTLKVDESFETALSESIYIEDVPYVFGSTSLTLSGIYSQTYAAVNGCDSIVTLTLSVIDTSIVIDITPPEIRCNEIDIYLNKEGRYVLKPEDFKAISAGTTDNMSAYENIQIDVFRKSFNCNDSGREITVEVKATDEAGNEARCSVVLLVQDTFELKVAPIADVDVILPPGICETQISYPSLVTPNMCAEFMQIAGLGANGIYPVGTTNEEWVLTNPSGDSIMFSFNVNVIPENDVPTIDPIADIQVEEDHGELKIPLNGISFGNDCIPQEISITASGMNPALITNIAIDYSTPDPTGMLRLTIAPDMSGSEEVTVVVADSEGTWVAQTFTVIVAPVNDPPIVVNPIPDIVINASYPKKYPIAGVPDGIFGDIDNTGLIYGLAMADGGDLPGWISIQDDSLSIMPMIADTGCVAIVVKATDPLGGMVADTFNICVDGYPTGNNDHNVKDFDIEMYPNPTTGEVNLKINSLVPHDMEVVVKNIAGSEVFKEKFKTTGSIKIDLSNHVSGIYLIKVNTGNNSIVKKLILDRR